MEKEIKDFWERSINRTLYKFDFDNFFKRFNKSLKHKLSNHGLLRFKDYLESLKEYYDLSVLNQFEYIGKHSGLKITKEDLLKSIFFQRYQFFRNRYTKNKPYKKMMEVYKEISKYKDLDLKERIFLVDKCIHLEHNDGSIINIDISQLKAKYDKKIERLEFDEAFGILTRNALNERTLQIKSANIIFIDFNGLSKMNEQYGYENVNKIFRNMFSSFDFNSDLVGRYFSGDEVLIITQKNIDKLVQDFTKHCNSFGLSFKYNMGRFDSKKESFEEFMKKLVGEIK